MLMWEWAALALLMAVGAAVGFMLGLGSKSSALVPARVHKTISFDAGRGRDDAELDSEMAAREADEEGATGAEGTTPTEADGASPDVMEAEDADEDDLQTTLLHMKNEHAQHLKDYHAAAAAAAAARDSPNQGGVDHSSPPVAPDTRRRIFIIAKHLPCHITNVTGQPTPFATPMGSPIAGPTATPSFDLSGDNALDLGPSGAHLLGSPTAATAADGTMLPPPNSFDHARRPSLSAIAALGGANVKLPGSTVVDTGGTRLKVEWEDSRSFLSNLRCLLTPHGVAGAAGASSSSSGPTPAAAASAGDVPEVTWIGLSSVPAASSFSSPAERATYESTLRENHCVPVYMEKDVRSGYSSFCKGILWPLLHYMMPTNSSDFGSDVGQNWATYWDSYQTANQLFADTIVSEMKSASDVIWIHNMHLFSLPSMIRERMPRASIGLFIHTPFPSSDVFRSLPARREILESMMEADLLGFHTFDYARHFLSCIKRVLDLDFETLKGGMLGVKYNGRFVSIVISHIGIQSAVFKECAASDVLKRRVDKLRTQYAGKKLIVGVDDVDARTSPLLKLQAFDRFLARHPEWVSKVAILEMFLPSKNMDKAAGVIVQRELDGAVAELRRKYGAGIIEIIAPWKEASLVVTDHDSSDTAPSGLKLLELVRLYNAADVVLISTFFDGLNVKPFECTASQGSSVPCALIISEFMGCSRSLNGVLRINPWSLEAISDALHTALMMSADERRANHQRRFNYVMNHNIERWASGFLDQLQKAVKLGAELNYHSLQMGGNGGSRKRMLVGLKSGFTHLPMVNLCNMYSTADLRVLLLDYDGTLVPADKSASPSHTMAPPAGVIRLLRVLSEQPNTVVFVMSGRTRSVLLEQFGDLPNLGLAAEKGLFLKFPQSLANQCRFDRKCSEAAQADLMVAASSGSRRASASSVHAFPSDDDDDDDDDDSDDDALDPTAQSSDIANPSPFCGEWECIVPLDDISWKATALEIIQSYTEQTDGSWIEDKEFAIVWHYEQADVEYGRMQAADLQKYLVKVLANPAVDVLRYDKSRILEVKPHGVNKGLAATAILESLWILHEKRNGAAWKKLPRQGSVVEPPQLPLSPRSQVTSFHPFVLAMGDDRSDEEMFNAVQQKLFLDGRVRGRDCHPPLVDAFTRAVATQSAVPTSIPPTPSRSLHDPESSPMSPVIAGMDRSARATPSADPFLFTVCVGMKPSSAQYFVNNVEEVLRSLYGLVLRDYEDRPADMPSPRTGLTKRINATGSSSNAATSSPNTNSPQGADPDAARSLGPKRSSFANMLFGKVD